jgi:hypothetical protein
MENILGLCPLGRNLVCCLILCNPLQFLFKSAMENILGLCPLGRNMICCFVLPDHIQFLFRSMVKNILGQHPLGRNLIDCLILRNSLQLLFKSATENILGLHPLGWNVICCFVLPDRIQFLFKSTAESILGQHPLAKIWSSASCSLIASTMENIHSAKICSAASSSAIVVQVHCRKHPRTTSTWPKFGTLPYRLWSHPPWQTSWNLIPCLIIPDHIQFSLTSVWKTS